MLVSIIIPFYKGNLYINRTLSCIENNVNYCSIHDDIRISIETIIINDYPDEDVILEKEYRGCHLSIYKNKENCGIHFSRVRGINLAKGKYVILLDQDDMIKDNALYSQCQAIKEGDIVFSDGYIEDLRNGVMKQFTIFRNKIVAPYILNINTYLCADNPIISPGQVLMKRTSIPIAWMQHILKENGSDDLLLWILFLSDDKKAYYNSDILYIHKYTGANYSLNNLRMLNSDKKVYELLKNNKLISSKHLKRFSENILYKSLKLDNDAKMMKYLQCKRVILYRVVYRFIRGIGKGLYILKKIIN